MLWHPRPPTQIIDCSAYCVDSGPCDNICGEVTGQMALWRHSGGHEVSLLLFTPSATQIVPWAGPAPGPLHGADFGPTTLSDLCSGPSALRFLTVPGTCSLVPPHPCSSTRQHEGSFRSALLADILDLGHVSNIGK